VRTRGAPANPGHGYVLYCGKPILSSDGERFAFSGRNALDSFHPGLRMSEVGQSGLSARSSQGHMFCLSTWDFPDQT
jgi:hypothetical protein